MRQLDATLATLAEENPSTAIGALLRLNGEVVWEGNVGIANRETGAALARGARVPIYSLTKTFTAVVALSLARENHLAVAGPVSRWFPELPLPETMTIAHLLRHTSGLKDYFSLPEYRHDVCHRPKHPWSEQDFLEAILPQGLLFEPGEGWAYSNIGYLLLRQIIERVANAPFAEAVAQFIAQPLGLKDTFVAREISDWATCIPGYGREVSSTNEAIDIRHSYHPAWCAPGVAVSTPSDVTFFYNQLLQGKILNEAELALMCSLTRVPWNHPPAVEPSCGMGLLGDPGNPLGASFGHGGGGPGYSIWASTLQRPAGRLSFMVFANTSEARSDLMQDALLRAACDELR